MLTVRVKVRAIPPTNKFRLLCFRIAQNSKFEYFIIACIVLNTLVLAMDYYDKSEDYGVSLRLFLTMKDGTFDGEHRFRGDLHL